MHNGFRDQNASTPKSNFGRDDDPSQRQKNPDGTPVFFKPDKTPSTQKAEPSGSIGDNRTDETSSQLNLLGQKIQLSNTKYTITGQLRCNEEDLYAVECDKSLTGYNGQCPKCGVMHVLFNDSTKGYYASAKNINDHVQKQKIENERLQGRKPIDQLPVVKQSLPPLDEPITGKNKGIEGDSNSCYMDATIFCMFAYNNTFDSLLHMNVESDALKTLQSILRDNIVHVLRNKNYGFVERDAVFYLRAQLSEAMHDPSFKEMEKDPSEFLRSFEELFHYAPLKTIAPDQPPKSDESNITKNIVWEMFDANPYKLISTSIASIFRNSLSEIPARLATIPSCLVLMAPRHTRSRRSYPYIIPDRQITLDNDMVQMVCLQCKKTNHDREAPMDFFFCSECYSKESSNRPQPTTDAAVKCYCHKCMREYLHPSSFDARHSHDLRKIDIKKHKLNLFAVLCIETCHYVAFVKCQNQSKQQHEWLFFDSMSDREFDEKNIPLVHRVPDFERWIDDAERNTDQVFNHLDYLVRQPKPMSQKFDEDGIRRLRLFRDGAFFFYENANVNSQ